MDTEEQCDADVQQALLDKLMQYGDSLLDTEDYEKRKADVKKSRKKQKKGTQNGDTLQLHLSELPEKSARQEVKKKQKKSRNIETEEPTNEQVQTKRRKKRNTFVEFEEELRTFKEERKSEVSDDVTETEKEMEKSHGPEVIVFDDPAKRNKKRQEADSSSEFGFDLNKARLEVQKFGYSGFDYNDRKKFEQERAIKLGAKPPKREYVNYKQLQQQLKQQRNYERNKREKDKQLGMPVKAKDDEKDPNKTFLRHHGFWKDRSTERGFHLDGQVGRYRPGVLWLNKQDIAKVRGKSKKSGNKSSKQQNNSKSTGERTGGSKSTGGKGKRKIMK